MYVATLIADALTKQQVDDACQALAQAAGAGPGRNWHWLEEGCAADLPFAHAGDPDRSLAQVLPAAVPGIDVIVQPLATRAKRLLVADMDSTMITVECIDELADYAGIKAEIAAVTEAAMRGDLDFAAALDARVALLAGLEESAIDRCLAERVRNSDGAATLIRTLAARGVRTVLVSGGFTRFAEPVGARLGFHRVVANRLEIADGRLTGAVGKPIVDAGTKLAVLCAEAEALDMPLSATIAIGDGANDLPMIRAAGLGIAYRAKPVVAAQAGARLDHAPLSHLLYAMGIPRADWVSA